MSAPAGNLHHAHASRITVVLACAFGVMFLARYSLGFLAPQMQEALDLEPKDLGLLAAILATGWSVSGWIVSKLVTVGPGTRAWLTGLLLLLALSCVAASAAVGHLWLMSCALIFGIAGGPVLPLIQSVAMQTTNPQHRGLIMGLVQSAGGSVIAKVIGPMLLVPCAERFGWRVSFLLIAGVALLCACFIFAWVPVLRSLERAKKIADIENSSSAEEMEPPLEHSSRNVFLCCCIGGLMVGWLMLATTFFPLYLTSVRGFSPITMSQLVAAGGTGSLLGVTLIPWLSDYFGRRRILASCATLGVVTPAALLLHDVSGSLLGFLIFAGSFAGGIFPLFMSIVPAESVTRSQIATAISTVQAVAELVGGVIIPLVVGWLANQYGLHVAVLAALIAALLTSALAIAIKPPELMRSASMAKPVAAPADSGLV